MIIGECRIWPDKYIVFNCDSVPNLNTTLDCDAVANTHIVFNKRMIAGIALRTDHSTWQHVGERPYPRTLSELRGSRQSHVRV